MEEEEAESLTDFQMVERRPLRSFSRADEYLYAMKEDLSEWLNLMYDIDIDAENFMARLETGEYLVKHANAIRIKHMELSEKIRTGKRKLTFSVPQREVPLRENVSPGSWFARDNVFNFIQFCRCLGVMECVMFETEDLVCRKNEKHVVLTLLEVARRGAKLGMLAPILVQFEQEIDREIAREEKEQQRKQRKELLLRERLNCCEDMFNSMQVNINEEVNLNDFDDFDVAEEDGYDEEEEEEEEEDEDYNYPIGPLPQLVTNDLKSLDDMVRELVSDCQCPTQFPVIRVSEGKYRIGDSKVLIFVRILRNHVMVRVGGGWDTLQHYLDKHDPCRCKVGHKSTIGVAHIATRVGKGPMAVGVCYDREDSPSTPGTPRRRSSSNLSAMGGRRSSSVTPLSPAMRSASPASRQVPRSLSRDVLNRPVPQVKQPQQQQQSNKNKHNFQTIHNKSMLSIDRSDSSCSIPSTSNLGDSGSEVSDEGYKSCQGLSSLTKPPAKLPSLALIENKESSDCSSTISSDDDDDDDAESSSIWTATSTTPTITATPTLKKKETANIRKTSPARSLDGRKASLTSTTTTTTPISTKMNRSRSSCSMENGSFGRGSFERRSYRVPQKSTIPSRYMQAAENYANKRRSSGYRPPSRAASASPFGGCSASSSSTKTTSIKPTSTHSTPARRPPITSATPSIRLEDDDDDDNDVLKRMEEILLTYKSQVEGRLALEGRQLPKEIFEDFTSHWVNSTTKKSSKQESKRILIPAPSPRKEFRETAKEKTKIPVPTFYDTCQH